MAIFLFFFISIIPISNVSFFIFICFFLFFERGISQNYSANWQVLSNDAEGYWRGDVAQMCPSVNPFSAGFNREGNFYKTKSLSSDAIFTSAVYVFHVLLYILLYNPYWCIFITKPDTISNWMTHFALLYALIFQYQSVVQPLHWFHRIKIKWSIFLFIQYPHRL